MPIQLKTNDQWYYKQDLETIKKHLNHPKWLKPITKLIKLPLQEDIKQYITNDTIAFLSAKQLDNTNLIITKYLPNTQEDGTKTYQQVLYDEDINTELYNLFGMTVSNPTLTFNDLRGFDEAKRNLLKVQSFVQKKYVQKNLSIFLGVSRSGKSFFAECLAGELNYKLILLDLGVIIADKNPSKLLDEFFNYLQNIDNYVLLIDEIEKVVDPTSSNSMSKVLMGKLLTIFNDFNSDNGFNIKDNFVIATANNITTLLERNPEFINRFSLKYFIGYPTKETFINVCNYYIKKLNIIGIDGNQIFNIANMIYNKAEIPKLDNTKRVIFGKYAAGEIKEFMTNLLVYAIEKDNQLFCDNQILKETLYRFKPQIVFADKGVINTIQAAKKANFQEIN